MSHFFTAFTRLKVNLNLSRSLLLHNLELNVGWLNCSIGIVLNYWDFIGHWQVYGLELLVVKHGLWMVLEGDVVRAVGSVGLI